MFAGIGDGEASVSFAAVQLRGGRVVRRALCWITIRGQSGRGMVGLVSARGCGKLERGSKI